MQVNKEMGYMNNINLSVFLAVYQASPSPRRKYYGLEPWSLENSSSYFQEISGYSRKPARSTG